MNVLRYAGLFIGLALADMAMALDNTNTRLLSQPAISSNHIAFVYAEDLWVANKDGSYPRRLTIDEGVESQPVFSPDGKMIAFSAQYDGNTDVFVVPVEGGVPRRLTWHPGGDLVRDWTPDGKAVLFISGRNSFTGRYAQLYTVDLASGFETQLAIPNANWASYSPDGAFIAYTPLYDAFNQWKHYRGGMQTRIWIYNTKTHAVAEVPKPAAGANDSKPVWVGNKVFFRSDRNGEFNMYSYDPSSKQVTQHSRYNDFGVMWLNGSKNEVIYEQAGYLHTMDASGGNSKQIKVGIATDLLDLRERFVKGDMYMRSGDISPSGVRLVMDYRGDIITLPTQKGDPLNITQTPGVHEKYPAWSPDGKTIAFFSDASGEYALHLAPSDGSGEAKPFKLNGSGFYANIHWSPDSKRLCFVDNGRRLYVMDVAAGKVSVVGEDKLYVPGPFRELFGSWSHDGNFISYTTIGNTNFEQAFVYSVAENKSYAVSDGLSNVTEPVFDPSGKYLYMLASTDAGPVVNWFDQSNQDMRSTNTIYLVTLQKTVTSPFAKENEVEEIKDSSKTAPPKDNDKKSLVIDWDGITNRIQAFPISTGSYNNLAAAKEGEIYYISSSPDGSSMIHRYSLKKRKEEPVTAAGGFIINAKGDKMLLNNRGKWSVVAPGQKPTPESMVNTSTLTVKTDPRAEWKNIFYEAWRVNRDYFYDPGMHGANWEAMKKKYEVFLPDVAAKSDLYRVMQWMFSELSVGHHRFQGTGDSRVNTEFVPGGLLGADYEVAGNHYRIKKIYGGLNWTPGLRSPLTEPGVDARVGDYILEVNGQPVTTSNNFYSYFENTSGKIITLKLSQSADGGNARTVEVVPIASESALRNRDWVEGNMKKVHAATNGRVAYVYVPNTTTQGHEYFKRYFFPQADKEAIIVDERFNGGGQLADYYIDLLKKPVNSYWNFRHGGDLKAPNASIQGPKVMLIDETAGSGGDYLPFLFRQQKLGTLVGKTTWGGLVGILGYPEFIDGGSVTAPNVAFYDENGFGIENVGTPPDVEVEQWPADVIAGRDPQLEKAIEIIMKQLKENPPKKMKTPAYPVRVKK